MDQEIAPLAVAREGGRNGRWAFAVSILFLACACLFAGVMLGPTLQRWRRPKAPAAAEVAAILEHSVVDVRLGRAAPLVDQLGVLAAEVSEPATKDRLLGLWAEAALQAGRIGEAARADALREGLAKDSKAARALRLRRIGLAVALGQPGEAAGLAKPLLTSGDSSAADEARLRLLSGMKEDDLRAWVTSRAPADVEEARRGGLAAIRLLGDAKEAERLLAPLAANGPPDTSLLQTLVDVYGRLDSPNELARVAGVLAQTLQDGEARSRVALIRAEALARAGDADAALAALEPLRHSEDFSTRQAVRRARYLVLKQAGRLDAEVRALRDPAERAFVALEIQRRYAEAVRLYEAAGVALPDSVEVFGGLQEAKRRLDLAERRVLYEQVLAKDPEDGATREKLLAALVALGDVEAARQWVGAALKGREGSPAALVEVALAMRKAGLDRDAASSLERAYALEPSVAQKEQILFALGDLYAASRQEIDARRLYTNLATGSANQETRDRALARLSILLY